MRGRLLGGAAYWYDKVPHITIRTVGEQGDDSIITPYTARCTFMYAGDSSHTSVSPLVRAS